MPFEEGINLEGNGADDDAVMDLWYVVESNSWIWIAMLQCEISVQRRQDWKD